MKKIILDLCGGTGAWAKPYLENGYDVRTLTLPDFNVENWREYKWFWELIDSGNVYGVLVAPPCTMFSIARNDKTAKVPRDFRKGMKTVSACLEIIWECQTTQRELNKKNLEFWALENPHTGYLKHYLGIPTLVFDPSEYGDNHTKRTALWGKFNKPVKTTKALTLKGDENNYVKSVEKFFDEKKHLIPQDYRKKTGLSMRTVVRSITPQGFAKAFYEANK